MKTTGLYERITDSSQLFHDLKRMGRENFTYGGAKALQEYLEQLSEDIGEVIDYDPISFCCEYQEFENIAEFNEQYDTEYESMNDIDETTVIPVDDESFIIQQF